MMAEKIFIYFSSSIHYKRHSQLFKRLLYLLVLIKCVFWLLNYSLLFGENSMIITKPFVNLGFIKQMAFALYQMKNDSAAYFFILPCLLLALAGFFKFRIHILSDLLIWFLIINIHNRVYSTLSGGEILLNQLLFFNAFIAFSSEANMKKEGLLVILHNLGVLSVMVQVCFVYFFSAYAKMQNDSWINGTALISTLQVSYFSNPTIINLVQSIPLLFVILNYVVLGYQLLFPALIWIKKIKKPFICIGILMHLFIVFSMGLVTFGSVMILTYIYFWPLEEESGI